MIFCGVRPTSLLLAFYPYYCPWFIIILRDLPRDRIVRFRSKHPIHNLVQRHESPGQCTRSIRVVDLSQEVCSLFLTCTLDLRPFLSRVGIYHMYQRSDIYVCESVLLGATTMSMIQPVAVLGVLFLPPSSRKSFGYPSSLNNEEMQKEVRWKCRGSADRRAGPSSMLLAQREHGQWILWYETCFLCHFGTLISI